MEKLLLVYFVIAPLLLPMTNEYGQDATSREEAFATSVKSLMDKMSAAVLAGDIESWISLWDENAVRMPDDQYSTRYSTYALRKLTWTKIQAMPMAPFEF